MILDLTDEQAAALERELTATIDGCGLGGVLSALRIASSRRRAVSSGLYCSSGPLSVIGG
jgi:hypothetical protein